MIYDHAGISLSDAKRDLVYSRLARRLRANSLTVFSQYLNILDGNEQEWEAFVNSLTTNLTSFFRENHHFPLLADHIKHVMHRKPIQLWCSAASTGEEPYSIAMTMIDLFGSFTPPVQILATDIDTNVLKKAGAGVYTEDRIEKLSPDIVKRFFLRGTGENEGMVRIRQELRDMVTFRQLNLLDNNWPIRGPFEAIFCRNVMIYFDKPTQFNILKKFIPVMRNDGLLFAGHSESFYHAADLFKIQGKTVYEIAAASKHLAHH
jgi:chemotaxis protein methyltransferase CheR